MTLDADLVAIAHPVAKHATTPPGEDQPIEYTLAIDQTFKGHPPATITVQQDAWELSEVEEWMQSPAPQLVFLLRSTDAPGRFKAREYWCLRPAPFSKSNAVLAMTSDFRELHDDVSIAAEVKRIIASQAGEPVNHTPADFVSIATSHPDPWAEDFPADGVAYSAVTLPLPDDVEMHAGLGTNNSITVVLNERQMQVALDWAARGWAAQAVPVLWFFKNDRSIAALKVALQTPDDHNWIEYSRGMDKVRYSFVPDAAYERLRRWGVAVQRPAITLPDDAERGGVVVAGIAIGGLAVLSACVWAGRRICAWLVRLRVWRVSSIGTRIFAGSAVAGCVAVAGLVSVDVATAQRVMQIRVTVHDHLGVRIFAADHAVLIEAGTPDQRTTGVTVAVLPPDLDMCEFFMSPLANSVHSVFGMFLKTGSSVLRPTDASPVTRLRCVGSTFGWIIGLLAAYPVTWIIVVTLQFLRLRRRLERRHCVACGYDLRGSAGRCPECGSSTA